MIIGSVALLVVELELLHEIHLSTEWGVGVSDGDDIGAYDSDMAARWGRGLTS